MSSLLYVSAVKVCCVVDFWRSKRSVLLLWYLPQTALRVPELQCRALAVGPSDGLLCKLHFYSSRFSFQASGTSWSWLYNVAIVWRKVVGLVVGCWLFDGIREFEFRNQRVIFWFLYECMLMPCSKEVIAEDIWKKKKQKHIHIK